MKPFIILVMTAALVAMVAERRHHHLSELKQETLRLEQQGRLRPPDARRSEAEPLVPASNEQVKFVSETFVEFLTSRIRPGGPGLENTEHGKKFLLAARVLSAGDITTAIEHLRSDPRVAGVRDDMIISACHELFGDIAPFAWREYLTAHRDLPDWQVLFERVSQACLREDGKRALKMIDQEAARGDTTVATTAIRSGVLLELATMDPDKMLERAVSPEYAADPDALLHLGGFVDDRFESLADHQRFLAALQRAQEKNPSPLLATIRKDYTREMTGVFSSWPAADAIALADSQFTRDERFSVAERCSTIIDLIDKEQWVDWFLKIDAAEWEAWSKQQGKDSKHPLVRQIQSQSHKDSRLPRQWLEKIPAGALREEAVLAYCWTVADREPDLAAGYLGELPEGKRKQNLVRKIADSRK